MDSTTTHVRRAVAGDAAATEHLVERLSPWLSVQARYRLAGSLRGLYDPEDLVHDVWLAVLPRLGELAGRGGRRTPALLRYLSATLLHRLRDLVEKHVEGKPVRRAMPSEAPLSATVSGAMTKAVRAERRELLDEALRRLPAPDRELLVLRGIERSPYRDIAVLLGATENALAVRYRRACAKLRGQLKARLLDELAGD